MIDAQFPDLTDIEHALALAAQFAAAAARGDDGPLSPTDADIASKALRAWAEAEALKKAMAF